MSSSREYDLVLFGATGYTGLYTAEHITTSLPTNLKWAVAGRSAKKLQGIVEQLKQLNSDRPSPAIEQVQLEDADLASIARKTKVLINCVGPYSLYSEPVVRACAENSTHYLDVTGEVPWVGKMVKKYHETAKSNGAIIIPQCGVESTPADLMSFMLTRELSKSASASTGEVVFSLNTLKGAPSGGTLATILAIFDTATPAQVQASMRTDFLTATAPPASVSKSLFTLLTGTRTVPGLGLLTTNPFGAPDVPIVYRSWSLYKDAGGSEAYGSRFQFSPFMRTRSIFLGTLIHLGALIGPLFLLFSPVRWLISKFVYQPGQGPTREQVANDLIEYRAIASADGSSRQATGRLRFQGSLYKLTGIFLAEAAATLLYDDGYAAKRLGGGVLTPATLGRPFADRLEAAGAKFETQLTS